MKEAKRFSWVLSTFFVVLFYIWVYYIANVITGLKFETWIFIALNVIFFVTMAILIIVQIIKAIFAVKREDISYCLHGLFFFKYTLLPAALAFILISLMILGVGISVSIALLIFPGGIFVAPILTAVSFILPQVLLAVIFMMALPGLVLGICSIILTKKEKKITLGECILHILLQLIPALDLIDGLFISIYYWKVGRVLAVISVLSVIAGSVIFRMCL